MDDPSIPTSRTVKQPALRYQAAGMTERQLTCSNGCKDAGSKPLSDRSRSHTRRTCARNWRSRNSSSGFRPYIETNAPTTVRGQRRCGFWKTSQSHNSRGIDSGCTMLPTSTSRGTRTGLSSASLCCLLLKDTRNSRRCERFSGLSNVF
jgi:hypothetical protein